METPLYLVAPIAFFTSVTICSAVIVSPDGILTASFWPGTITLTFVPPTSTTTMFLPFALSMFLLSLPKPERPQIPMGSAAFVVHREFLAYPGQWRPHIRTGALTSKWFGDYFISERVRIKFPSFDLVAGGIILTSAIALALATLLVASAISFITHKAR